MFSKKIIRLFLRKFLGFENLKMNVEINIFFLKSEFMKKYFFSKYEKILIFKEFMLRISQKYKFEIIIFII